MTAVAAGARTVAAGPRLRPPIGRRSRTFLGIFLVVLLLCGLGLVMVLSSSVVTSIDLSGSAFTHATRQAMWLAVGFVAALVTMRFDYHRWRSRIFTTTAVVVTLVALAVQLIPSPLRVVSNGAGRWLRLGPVIVQPSEVAKLALVLYAASLLSRRIDRVERVRDVLLPVLVVFGVMAGLILGQRSLGSVLLLAAILLVMLFMVGVPGRHLGGLLALGAGAAAPLVFLAEYRRARVLSFLDPWADPYGAGYQSVQAQVGIASGGLFGVGPGGSRADLAFLPYAHTDFIFVIIAEELGLIGAAAVVGLFLLLGVLGVRAVRDAPDPYGMLLAAGISGWLVLQAFANIAVAVGLAPTMGVPLPFISYGGSSLVANLAATGILMNVARQGRSR